MPSLFGPLTIFRFALIGAKRQIFNTSIAPFRIFTYSLLKLGLFFAFLVPGLDAKVLSDIYWNSSNPIFRIDNTEHVFNVKIHDRVDFVCPFYSSSSAADQTDVEVMEIYSVSKWAYDYCALTPDSVLAGVCNNPFQRTYATIVFREYTPKPGGLEFKPGRSYYFISASTGQPGGVQNKHGGLCSSKNMKVKFEVDGIDPDASTSKSIDGYPAAGGVVAHTKLPSQGGGDDDGYDDQYQMVPSNGNGGQIDGDSAIARPGDSIVSSSSRTHDNSRELKKQNNISKGKDAGNDLDLTTPRLYEIHTRPDGDVVDWKRTDHKENYEGSNAQPRGNLAIVNFLNWRIMILLLSIYSIFVSTSTS